MHTPIKLIHLLIIEITKKCLKSKACSMDKEHGIIKDVIMCSVLLFRSYSFSDKAFKFLCTLAIVLEHL